MNTIKVINDIILNNLKNGQLAGLVTPFAPVEGGYLERAFNYKSGASYTGINALLLPPGYYLTFNQAKSLGGQVKKGAKGFKLIYCSRSSLIKYEDADVEHLATEEEFNKFPNKENFKILDTFTRRQSKFYTIFNITDIENLPEIKHENLIKKKPLKLAAQTANKSPIADIYANAYLKRENIKLYEGKNSFYDLKNDEITIGKQENFKNANEFYEQLFHEISHSTGAKNRLERKTLLSGSKFGEFDYSLEEITAEISALYCLKNLGLLTMEQAIKCTQYIKGRVESAEGKKGLEAKPLALYTALNNASKAFEFIFNQTN